MVAMPSRAAATRPKESYARLAQRRLHQGVQRRQETGAVRLGQRRRAAAPKPGLSQMPRDLATGQRRADVVRGPGVPVMRQGPRPARQAAGSERDVGGDAHVRGALRSAIQSSASSGAPPTVTISTLGRPGGRMGREPFDTTRTGSPRRVATRNASSRTGQASASMNRVTTPGCKLSDPAVRPFRPGCTQARPASSGRRWRR